MSTKRLNRARIEWIQYFTPYEYVLLDKILFQSNLTHANNGQGFVFHIRQLSKETRIAKSVVSRAIDKWTFMVKRGHSKAMQIQLDYPLFLKWIDLFIVQSVNNNDERLSPGRPNNQRLSPGRPNNQRLSPVRPNDCPRYDPMIVPGTDTRSNKEEIRNKEVIDNKEIGIVPHTDNNPESSSSFDEEYKNGMKELELLNKQNGSGVPLDTFKSEALSPDPLDINKNKKIVVAVSAIPSSSASAVGEHKHIGGPGVQGVKPFLGYSKEEIQKRREALLCR